MYAYIRTCIDSCVYMFILHRNVYAPQCVYTWLQISGCDLIYVINTHFVLSTEYIYAEQTHFSW